MRFAAGIVTWKGYSNLERREARALTHSRAAQDRVVFASDGGWPVFTGSGVASAKQTGHCGLNNRGLAATICSAVSLPLIQACLAGDAPFFLDAIFSFIWTNMQCLLKDTPVCYFDCRVHVCCCFSFEWNYNYFCLFTSFWQNF